MLGASSDRFHGRVVCGAFSGSGEPCGRERRGENGLVCGTGEGREKGGRARVAHESPSRRLRVGRRAEERPDRPDKIRSPDPGSRLALRVLQCWLQSRGALVCEQMPLARQLTPRTKSEDRKDAKCGGRRARWRRGYLARGWGLATHAGRRREGSRKRQLGNRGRVRTKGRRTLCQPMLALPATVYISPSTRALFPFSTSPSFPSSEPSRSTPIVPPLRRPSDPADHSLSTPPSHSYIPVSFLCCVRLPLHPSLVALTHCLLASTHLATLISSYYTSSRATTARHVSLHDHGQSLYISPRRRWQVHSHARIPRLPSFLCP